MIQTDDFLADLEAHLREAAEREEARRAAPRWPRAVVRLAVPALAVAALVALAVAVLPLHATERPVQALTPTPTTTAAPSPALVKQATALVRRAQDDTAKRPSCRFGSGGPSRLVDGSPLPAITAALPALATPSADRRGGLEADAHRLRRRRSCARRCTRSRSRGACWCTCTSSRAARSPSPTRRRAVGPGPSSSPRGRPATCAPSRSRSSPPTP